MSLPGRKPTRPRRRLTIACDSSVQKRRPWPPVLSSWNAVARLPVLRVLLHTAAEFRLQRSFCERSEITIEDGDGLSGEIR